MTFDYAGYVPKGDKKNSAFFEEYRGKIYERRHQTGVEDLVGPMRATVIQVEPGDGVNTVAEPHRMTPYRHHSNYSGETHKHHVLTNKPDYPVVILMEPYSDSYEDYIRRLNALYPLARNKPNTRYVGEISACDDLKTLRDTLEKQFIRFKYKGDTENPFFTRDDVLFSTVSDFTGNRVGYSGGNFADPQSLGLGEAIALTADEKKLSKTPSGSPKSMG